MKLCKFIEADIVALMFTHTHPAKVEEKKHVYSTY